MYNIITMKKALITGINGSGATYLAEFLSTINDLKINLLIVHFFNLLIKFK